jgi:hypothetical protein
MFASAFYWDYLAPELRLIAEAWFVMNAVVAGVAAIGFSYAHGPRRRHAVDLGKLVAFGTIGFGATGIALGLTPAISQGSSQAGLAGGTVLLLCGSIAQIGRIAARAR